MFPNLLKFAKPRHSYEEVYNFYFDVLLYITKHFSYIHKYIYIKINTNKNIFETFSHILGKELNCAWANTFERQCT